MDVNYYSCAKDEDGFWCSTKVDGAGFHIPNGGHWGICGPKCPIPGNRYIDGKGKMRRY